VAKLLVVFKLVLVIVLSMKVTLSIPMERLRNENFLAIIA
jgi:hypothetical protein